MSTISSSTSSALWKWNDNAKEALGEDFCSDEQLQLAYSIIRQAVAEKQLQLTAAAPTNGRLPLTFANEYIGTVPISWPALQRQVIALSMSYADNSVDIVTGLWTATGAPSGYSNSDPASWPPSASPPGWGYKPVNDGKTPWPGPNGFTRKAPRQIRSMDATYVSGPTVVINNSSTNASAYSVPPVLSYTTGYATPAQEGDVARFTVETQAQAVPSPITDVTYAPAIPALPATPISDYGNANQYFKRTSGAWVPYTSDDAPVKALVADYGPMMIGDYLGTWIIADLNTAINKLTRTVIMGFGGWPTNMTTVNVVQYTAQGEGGTCDSATYNPNITFSIGDAYNLAKGYWGTNNHTAGNYQEATGSINYCTGLGGSSSGSNGDTEAPHECGSAGMTSSQGNLVLSGLPDSFYQRRVTFLGSAGTGTNYATYLANSAFPSQNTITQIGESKLTCCPAVMSDTTGTLEVPPMGPLSDPDEGTFTSAGPLAWSLNWTAAVLDWDVPAGFKYVANPQAGACAGGCTPIPPCSSPSDSSTTSTSTSTTTPTTTTTTTTSTSTSTSTTTPTTTTSTSTSTTTPTTSTTTTSSPTTTTTTDSTSTTTSPTTTTTTSSPTTTSTTDTTSTTTTTPSTTPTTTATTTSTSTVTPTTVTSATTTTCGAVDVGASAAAHCFQLGSCGSWTAGGDGHIHPIYNDAIGSMADNTGSFTLNWTAGGVTTTYTIAGTDTTGPNIPVTAGTTYSWTATGTIANAPLGNARYFSGGPDGGNAPGESTYCDSANYAALIALFTPLAAGEACDVCNDGRGDGPYGVGDSTLTSRCLIYSFTCIDIGATTSGQSGTFTDSTGSVFAWSDTGEPAAASYTTLADLIDGGPHTPPSSVCDGTGNVITITRTA